MIALGFFSTRIVVDALGVSDYGISNVVGGFVSMFTLLNSILQTGTRRFLTLYLGKKDERLLKLTFSTAFVIHCGVALVVFLLLESFGLWFLNTQLNIETSRFFAANCVFQFSVISVMLSITQTPYAATVTAHEQFNIYAWLSIFDVVAKLVLLVLLYLLPCDKLIVYAALLLSVNVLNVILYRTYCIRSFAECSFSLRVDRKLFREMCAFSAWSTLGHVSAVLNMQGTNVLLNMFFNTIVNAAKGLAGIVLSTFEQFVSGFIIAAVPQLTKYYGAGDMVHFTRLVFNVSQYSLFLISILAVPMLLEIDYVLQLWLNTVPEYTATFIKITTVTYLIKYSNIMVDHGLNAIGRARELSLVTVPIYLLNFPLVYVALKLGFEPWAVCFVSMWSVLVGFIANLLLLARYANFPAGEYFVRIFLKNMGLVGVSALLPSYLHFIMPDGLLRFLVVCSVSVIITVLVIYLAGMSKDARQMVRTKLQKLWTRHA